MAFLLVGSAIFAAAQTASGSLPQTITIYPVADQTMGNAPFQVLALADSNLPVTLSLTGPATLNGRVLTLLGPGAVILTASQAGNTVYASATAQTSFKIQPALPAITFPAAALVYGMPPTTALNATAMAVPFATPSADAATLGPLMEISQITGGSDATIPAGSSVFRTEGGLPVGPYAGPYAGGYDTLSGNDWNLLTYRVAFTCDCQQFEFIIQGQADYRLWVDGDWVGTDATAVPPGNSAKGFVLVNFPDKRPRQIKISFPVDPLFYGIITAPTDTISASQVPVGQRVIFFGDSWTGPTIVAPALPPPQTGLAGSGYPELVGEYFNWDYWVSGVGGEGFTAPGSDPYGYAFPARALQDICGWAPDAVLFMGGINGAGGVSESDLQSAATSFLSNVQTCLPGVPVYFFGPQLPPNTALEAAMAAAAAPDPSVFYTDMVAQNWFYGSPTDPSTGNNYLYLNIHPTPLGHDFLGEKVSASLISQFPTLSPQPHALFSAVPAAGSFSYSATSATLLPAGANTVTATFTPADAVNYAIASATATVTVTKASTTTTVSSNVAQAPVGGSVTLTAKVLPQLGGVPSGSFTFLNNGTPLITVALDATGTATVTTGTLPAGIDSLTGAYAGDSNFNGSTTSAALPLPIVVPDFSFLPGATSITIQPGQSGVVSLTITPVNDFAGSLTLSCTGLPAGSTCSLVNPISVPSGGGAMTAQVTIQTSAAPAAAAGLGALFTMGLCFTRRRRRMGLTMSPTSGLGIAASLGIATLAGALLLGCGGGSMPAPVAPPVSGTFAVQIQLSSASTTLTHSETVSLVIP